MNEKSGIATDYRVHLADQIREIEHWLGRGSAKSYDEYLAKCAEIKAYLGALRIFEATLERYLSESETDILEDELK